MSKKTRIAELILENEKLASEATILRAQVERHEQNIERIERSNRSNGIAVQRLTDAVNHTINRILRQSVSQMTHSERNRQNNRIAWELLQLLSTINDIADMTDIPF